MSVSLPRQWLDRAKEDHTVARLVADEGHPSHACFLAQQSIEKALKAFLLARTNQYPRTHRLVDLLQLCTDHEPTFNQYLADCTVVDQYYIPTRYPDGILGGPTAGLPTAVEAQDAITATERILPFVEQQLP